MGSKGFTIDTTALRDATDQFMARVDRGVFAAVEYQRAPAETYMRTNAPWTDQTTNARNGLFAATEHGTSTTQSMSFSGNSGSSSSGSAKSHSLILGHSVPYGLWLEVRFAGRFAIVEPSLRPQGEEIMSNLRGLFGRI